MSAPTSSKAVSSKADSGTFFVFKLIVNAYFFWKLQIVFVELYNHYRPWNKSDEEVEYKIREKEKTRDAPRSKPQKKKKVSLKKLERTQRIRSEGLERIAYDPKSVEKFRGIVE